MYKNIYKKFFTCFFILLTLIMMSKSSNKISFANNQSQHTSEFRGIWISYIDLNPILYKKTETEFCDNIEIMFNNIKQMKLTDIIVQVRPFSDSLYKSSIFPQSHILTGIQGQNCGYDPLNIMINKAHEKNLKIHAWVNPYRIKSKNLNIKLSDNHPALKWISEKNINEVILSDNDNIYYNPCSKNVINLIVDGIKEIIKNYNVDGIHIDDYFYPSTNLDLDKNNYQSYKINGGNLSLNLWRMENVNILIKNIYQEIKKINPNILFGISPAGNINYNYTTQYSDVKKWLSEPGYIDYLCPQIYFGFKNEQQPYESVLNQWASLSKLPNINLYVGLSAYKINTSDKFALSGSKEWIMDNDIISRQILSCRKNNYDGFVLFRYNNLFNPESINQNAVNQEIYNIKSILD